MANLATCPKCAKQLGLPASIAATDRAECPECHAIFSLSETVQISLPIARVLDPAEQPAVAANLAQPTLKENATDALASNSAPLKSWEERLKNALALDDSDPAPENRKTEVPTAPVAAEAASSRSPSFEFELDPAPAAEEKTKPRPTPKASPKPTTERASSPSKTLADFATGELASAGGALAGLTKKLPEAVLPEPAESEATEVAEVAVQTVPRIRSSRPGFPKLAALAVGPALGILLGLYGLLWFQGAKADYVGLSRVLPHSLLPVGFGEAIGDADPVAEANSPGLMAKLREPPKEMKRDGAVKPASAAEPAPPGVSEVRIDADEFSALVGAATVALPEFTASDLSTSASIKRKGQAYMALCRLAEHIHFARQPGLAPAVQAKARQASQLYQQTASQANLRQDLAHIAGRWWEYEKRPSPGIFLVGEVQEAQPTGDGTLCWVRLGEQSTVSPIPVLLNHDRYQTDDQIGIVGHIILKPSELPPGFSGKQAVAASYDFVLQKAR